MWKLYNFRLNENPFLLKCVKEKTLLKDQEIWVYTRPLFEIEAEKTQKTIKEKLTLITNVTVNQAESLINKTDKILYEINDSKTTISEINKTTKQTNTSLTTGRKVSDCK